MRTAVSTSILLSPTNSFGSLVICYVLNIVVLCNTEFHIFLLWFFFNFWGFLFVFRRLKNLKFHLLTSSPATVSGRLDDGTEAAALKWPRPI